MICMSVIVFRDANGEWYTYSFGGYHADDDERTVIQADAAGGPFFKSSPIDVHCCDVCKYTLQPPNNGHTWDPLSFVERLSSFGGYFV